MRKRKVGMMEKTTQMTRLHRKTEILVQYSITPPVLARGKARERIKIYLLNKEKS